MEASDVGFGSLSAFWRALKTSFSPWWKACKTAEGREGNLEKA